MVALTGYAAEGDCVDSVILNTYSVNGTAPKWSLIIAYCNVLINMIMSYQVFGQSMFDTIESQVKWYLLKKKLKESEKSGHEIGLDTLPEGEEEDEDEDEEGGTIGKTPFDRAKTDGQSELTQRASYGFDHINLPPGKFSTALSEEVLVRCSIVHDQLSHQQETMPSAQSSLRAMFTHDTGFANEEVPLNDQGFLLPFWQRAIIRCTYVLLITILACVLPFFEAVAGLSGAISFFPMSIYFPFAMYKTLYGDTMNKGFLMFLKVIAAFTLVVGACATVGSFRNIIYSFQNIQIFNT